MNTKEFTVFLGNKCVATMRTGKSEWCCNNFTGAEGLTTDFTLILAVTTIVIVDEMVRCTTQRADGISGNEFTIAALNGFESFTVLPPVVFEKELPVLLNKGSNDRELIDFEFLIFR